jgi:outer membrane protein assembly factor BamB
MKKWLHPARGAIGRPAVGLVDGDRLVFVAARGFLDAVSAGSGTKKWKAILDGSSVTQPVAAGELVFVATHRGPLSGSDREETLHGIDASDGQIRWKLAAERRFGESRLLSTGPSVYFATDMVVSAVEARSGRLLWSFRADEIQGDLAADDRYLYVLTYRRSILGAGTTLHALSLGTGEKQWSRRLSGPEDIREVRQGVVYTSRSAIDASTGKTLWSFGGTGRESTRLISGDQVFLISSTVTYFGTNRVDQGYLYAIDAKTGKP